MGRWLGYGASFFDQEGGYEAATAVDLRSGRKVIHDEVSGRVLDLQITGDVAASFIAYAEPLGVLALIGGVWVAAVAHRVGRLRIGRLAKARARRAELGAVQAAEQNAAFEPERIHAAVAALLAAAEEVWTSGARPDDLLVARWALHKAELGDGVRFRGGPRTELLRVVNREGEDEDRVVVRVRVTVEWARPGPRLAPLARHRRPLAVPLDERWTLGHHRLKWELLGVDAAPLERATLAAPSIPEPIDDDARLREASLLDLSREDAVAGAKPGALVTPEGAPRARMLDLSVVDSRFAPALLEAALVHLVEVWEGACAGSDAPLRALATSPAAQALLHPPGRAWAQPRLLVRDAVLRRWDVVELDPAADPPRAVVDGSAELIAGSATSRGVLQPTWTLRLASDGPSRWRLVHSTDPVDGVQYLV